jgi:trafficking protein particle complex subunit 11
VAKLHVPFSLHLTIRNPHPAKSASIVVQLESEPSDGFVVSGLRNGRLPVVLPGSEEKLIWRLIPVECGYVRVPRFKVMDQRANLAHSDGNGKPNPDVDTEAEPIRVVDIRWDIRKADHEEETVAIGGGENGTVGEDGVDPGDPFGTAGILVLP